MFCLHESKRFFPCPGQKLAGDCSILVAFHLLNVLRPNEGFRADEDIGPDGVREIGAGIGDGTESAFQADGFSLQKFRKKMLFQFPAARMDGIKSHVFPHMPFLLFRQRQKGVVDGPAQGIQPAVIPRE